MRQARDGFTLTELMVASAISIAVIATTLGVFFSQSRMYMRQRQINEMQQNARSAADMLFRDLRMAGYGVPLVRTNFAQWVTWVSGITNAVVITQGTGSNPDTISIAAAFEQSVTALAAASVVGATSIRVSSGTGARFDTTSKKLIYLGRQELARITAISGDQLTISTLPSASQGLTYAYPTNTTVELVQVVTYACNPNPTQFPRRPYLTRDDRSGSFTNDLQKMAALGIEDLQATRGTNSVSVSITARAAEPDRTYTHPARRDHYRRTTWTAVVNRRN